MTKIIRYKIELDLDDNANRDQYYDFLLLMLEYFPDMRSYSIDKEEIET